jgi:hypothetical protein
MTIASRFSSSVGQPLDHKQQVAFHQPDRDGSANRAQYAQSGGLSQRLLAAALVLLGFEVGIGLLADSVRTARGRLRYSMAVFVFMGCSPF